MRKFGFLLFGFLLFGFLLFCFSLSACAPASEDGSGDASRPVVCTSIYPLYDFTQKIAGDLVSLHNLVPAGIDPHEWEPGAADIAALERADLLICNGAGLEFWLEDVLGALENKELQVVEAAQGIAGESEGEDEHGHSHDGALDPHVWLDPMCAKRQSEAIAAALQAIDAPNRESYARALEELRDAFDALDAAFHDTLDPLPKKDIIVAHEAYGYLCKAYGLTQHGIQGLAPDEEPIPSHMADIITLAKELDVDTVFFEELVNPKVAETIAEAAGAKTAALSPLEGLTDAQRERGDDYFSVMRQNLEALSAALS